MRSRMTDAETSIYRNCCQDLLCEDEYLVRHYTAVYADPPAYGRPSKASDNDMSRLRKVRMGSVIGYHYTQDYVFMFQGARICAHVCTGCPYVCIF